MKIVVKSAVPVILIVLSSVLLVLGQNEVLNLNTYPIEYKISLNATQLNSSDTFDGEVAIRIGVNIRSTDIRLNSYFLDIITAKLFEIDGELEKEMTIYISPGPYDLALWPIEYLQVDKQYIIKIEYAGDYQSLKRGLYKSGLSEKNETNEEITMIATNFVPQYASWVFPCYDDPTLKANFSLTIHHPVDYNAISNMDVLETKSNFSTLMANTTFRTTSSLSIHSLAFAVLLINYHPNCIIGDLKICVFYDNQHIPDDVELVQEITVNALNELKNYFGVTLDLPKLDIFPDDKNYPEYRSGSYGILNNNPMYYYFNLATSGLVLKEEIIRHTIRQVVTLYFGNLLIPQSWGDSWLIQGLSVLFEYIIADKLYPGFDEMNQFLSNLYEFGFIDQAIKTDNITSTEEWFYNGIEYKSAGFLYMFKNIICEDIFKTGLRTILSNASYHLINSDEFFNIFTQLAIDGEMIPSDYDLNTIMDPWLTEFGYPYVWMIRRYATNTIYSLQIKQSDALNMFGISDRTANWWIPYTCVGHFNSTNEWTNCPASNWLEDISEIKVDHGFETELDLNSWMLCNNLQSVFYYINYDPNNYRLLANQLYSDYTKIPAIARAQLLHAAFKTAEYELNSFGLIFQLCNYIHQEDTYTPLNTFINEFMKFARKMYGTAPYENIIKFIAYKIGPVYARIRPAILNSEINSLSFTDEKLRTKIIRMACFSGYNNCLEDMNILLAQMINGKTANEIMISIMEDELNSYILHYGMVWADENLFWKIVALSSESNELATALSFVRNSQLIDHLFEILTIQNYDIINGIQINILSYTSRASILSALLTNNLPALDRTIDFMIEKSSLLQKILDYEFESVLVSLVASIKTNERLEKLEELLISTSLEQSLMPSGLSEAQENVKWCNYRIPEFEDTLSVILHNIDGDNSGATMSASKVLLLSIVFGSQLIYTIFRIFHEVN